MNESVEDTVEPKIESFSNIFIDSTLKKRLSINSINSSKIIYRLVERYYLIDPLPISTQTGVHTSTPTWIWPY